MQMRKRNIFNEPNMIFQEKIIERSGLGDETGLSDGAHSLKACLHC